MKIPPSFKKAIADTFYDKTLWLCEKVVSTDSLGAIVGVGYTPVVCFKGSFQPNTSGSVVDESGNETYSGFRVACHLPPSKVKRLEHVIKYGDDYYEIVGVLPTDSALILNLSEVGK